MKTPEERKQMQERAHRLIEEIRIASGWYEREAAKELADIAIAKAKVESEIDSRPSVGF